MPASATHWLLTAALGPLLLLQGLYVRRVTPRLPEPDGPRRGSAGAGPDLRLLVLGDSAAAGVGATTQDEALSGQLVRQLARTYRVQWQLFAGSGWDTVDFLHAHAQVAPEPFDVLVLSLGVNDVTGNRAPRPWLRLQEELAQRLQQAHAPRRILLTGVPPMQVFPALPQPLRWYLGRNAAGMNRLLRQWAERTPNCVYVEPFAGLMAPGYMAPDGFHPGPRAYARWAERLAEVIRTSL